MRSLIHTCKFFLGLEAPFSQVTEKELALLMGFSRDAQVMVEIGCYEGKTTAALAEQGNGTIYSIDPFFRGRLGICYGEWIAHWHCTRKRLQNVRFLKGFSYDVAATFNEVIDFLFIDADHTYEGIKRDWEDWFPKVQNGGVIALHDCKQAINSPDYLGSMQFYDNKIPEISGIEQIAAVDSLVVFRVRK